MGLEDKAEKPNNISGGTLDSFAYEWVDLGNVSSLKGQMGKLEIAKRNVSKSPKVHFI